MNNEQIQTTSSASDAHTGQTAADNNTRIIRTSSEFQTALRKFLATPYSFTVFSHRQRPKPPLCAYSRKQALAEGREIQVTPEFIQRMSDEWDICFMPPVFLTQNAIKVCEIASGCGLYAEQGPLWAIFCVLDHATDCPLLGWGSPMVTRIPFEVSFGTSTIAPCVCLNLAWSTVDTDDPQPSFTVMLPEED